MLLLMGCVSLLLCMSSNFNWMLGTVNFTIWVLYIFVLLWIFLRLLLLIILHYSSKTYLSPQCPVSHEVFYSGWWEQALFLALQEHHALFVHILSDGPLLCGLFSSHECTAYFSAEHLRGDTCRSLEIHLCAVLSSLWFCLRCSSCRGASRCSSMSTQSRKSARLPWFTFFGKQNWLHGPVTVAQGPKLQKGPCLALILCGHHLELHNNFTFVFCEWNPMRQKSIHWGLGAWVHTLPFLSLFYYFFG